MPAIFFLESSNNLGGQEYQILTQISELRKRSWRPYLFCRKNSKISQFAAHSEIRTIHLPLRNALDIKSIFNILRHLIKINPVAIVLHSGHDANIGAISAKIYRLLFKKKVLIIRSRTYQPGVPNSFSYNNLFDVTFTPSEHLREKLLKNKSIVPSKVRVLYPGLDFKRIHDSAADSLPEHVQAWIIDKEGPFIIHGAMLRGEKGHLQFLQVFSDLLKKWPRLQYIIAGDGPERQRLEHEVSQLKIDQNVFFAGIVNPIVPLLKIADLAILPSHHEPLGMFQIESQYLQVPTLANRVGGIPETMEHHKTGLLVEDRVSNWIETLDWALANPLKMHNYGNNGKEFVMEKFSIKTNIDFLIHFIENYNHSN